MKTKLRDLLFPQPKSKIKAGEGKQEGKYKFFTSSPVQNKHIDVANYTKPALIFGTGGNASVHFCNEPFSTSTDCLVMFGRNEQELQTIYFFLRNNMYLLEGGFKGAGLKHISKEYILGLSIELPSSTVQQELLQKVSSIESMVAKRKEQLAKLDTLVKSRFIELFGDYNLAHPQEDWKSISEIGKVVGGSTPKTNVDEYWDGEYRWITPAELEADSGYIYDSVRKLTKAGVDSCSLQEMPVNTVILTSRAPIGKVAIAGSTFYCNQGFKNIVCTEEIVPRYLYILLLLNTAYLNSLGRGATFKEISKSIVENIRIPVPTIEDQTIFATFVEQIDKSKLAIQQSLEQLETLKKSLMQKYFG